MKNSKLKKPLWVKLTIIFLSVLLGLSILLGGFIGYFKLSVQKFYDFSKQAFEIPALSTGFVPQGFCYDKDQNWFLTTGYMDNNSASPIFVVDKDSGKAVKELKLYKDEQTIFTGHCGGIAFFDKYIFVASGSEKCLYVFDYSALKKANDGDKLVSVGTFSTGEVRPSCVSVSGSYLYIAEFYKEESAQPIDSHKMTTPNGDKNIAIAVQFSISKYYDKGTFGILREPKKIYSLPSKVQGFEVSGSNIYLSTSYGLAFSELLIYNSSKASTTTMDITIDKEYKDITVYHLDNKCLTKTIDAPPMTGEVIFLDNKLYIMNESASNKYFFGKFTDGKWCYAIDLTYYGL